MMTARKLLSLTSASLAALFLSACGEVETVDTQAISEATSEATQEPTVERAASTLAEAASSEAEAKQALRARLNTVPSLADITDPKLSVEEVKSDLNVLMGRGGNVAVLYGDKGALLVDDKFADNAQEILARVGVRSGARPVFVLNTHYHGDHSGSNAAMKEAGAVIIAHDGARDLMSKSIENQLFGRTTEARPVIDHPQLTFSSEMSLDFAGQTLTLLHTPNAHTGGDLIVHFTGSDVIHMGDNFFNGMFPYVDIDSGGSLEGMIAAQGAGLRLAGDASVVIPGHGAVTDKAGLQASYDRLVEIRDRMQTRIDAGDTLDDVLAADIYADYGMNEGFINNENITRIAYRSLTEGPN